MTLNLKLLVKIALAVILGNIDAVMSHQLVKAIPIWLIDVYAIPIEFTVISGAYTGASKLIKRAENARKDLL